jgi:hypothetical protein
MLIRSDKARRPLIEENQSLVQPAADGPSVPGKRFECLPGQRSRPGASGRASQRHGALYLLQLRWPSLDGRFHLQQVESQHPSAKRGMNDRALRKAGTAGD